MGDLEESLPRSRRIVRRLPSKSMAIAEEAFNCTVEPSSRVITGISAVPAMASAWSRIGPSKARKAVTAEAKSTMDVAAGLARLRGVAFRSRSAGSDWIAVRASPSNRSAA